VRNRQKTKKRRKEPTEEDHRQGVTRVGPGKNMTTGVGEKEIPSGQTGVLIRRRKQQKGEEKRKRKKGKSRTKVNTRVNMVKKRKKGKKMKRKGCWGGGHEGHVLSVSQKEKRKGKKRRKK